MDEKKVREAIETFQGQVDWLKRIDDKGCEEARRCCIEYFEIAIEALEKQLPKKPKHIHENYGKHLWKKNTDGSVDIKAFDGDIHGYAAECERCGSLAFNEELLEDDDCEVDEYYCPSCNCQVTKAANACKCGQLLDWSE